MAKVLADGLIYSHGTWHTSRWHCLTIDVVKRAIRPIPVGPNYPVYQYYKGTGYHPPELARDAGALASVGSDFTATRYAGVPLTSQPIGAFMLNGELWSSGQRSEGMFVVKQGLCKITGLGLDLQITRGDGSTWSVDKMNCQGEPQALTIRGQMDSNAAMDQIVLGPTTPGGGGTRDVRRDPTGRSMAPSLGEILIESEHPMPFIDGEEIVWTRTIDGDGALQHIISGVPIIVRAGQNLVPELDIIAQPPPGPDNWFVRENPRTCLGVSANGRTAYIVAVEGRLSTSAGYRLKELAALMIRLGAWDALNLDGGGSTHMWTKADGLVCDSCYGNGTLAGTRPQAYATAVF